MTTIAVLDSVGDARIALESVDVQAILRGLFADVVVTQVYRNLENDNIEVVYTFPLPLDAVLLDLSLELNGKILRGVVQPRTQAEEGYEDAIDEGDSAILLQQLEPGVFTLNVGNLLPGERAVIRFKYGQLHLWQADSLRLHLPTTIAPRYGDPAATGLAPHQIPESTLSASHGFTLAVRIEGALARADVDCPSHPATVTSGSHAAREITLAGGSVLMDRDFVLVLKEPHESTVEGFWAPDGEDYVVLASFHPDFPLAVPESPRCVKLVVDCSGSMAGDSIAQAKAALRDIISMLKPSDFFNLITFGSDADLLFSEPVMANKDNTRTAARFVEQIDARMGGTEIGAALNAAYGCGKVDGLPSDLLLITDGEVWNHQQIVEDATQSGHRVFTVGVGSAVSEAFVRRIAETTSGACELVSPGENMAERIVRHFRRIDQLRAQSVQIEWPSKALRQAPAVVETVYAGDTLHVFGWLRERPAGQVGLVMTFEDGRTLSQQVSISMVSDDREKWLTDLPRVAAHTRLPTLDPTAALDLAERYQLVTERTACVLVFDRDEDHKAGAVPALRKVPQLLAAGWSGLGRVGVNMKREVSYLCRSPIHEDLSVEFDLLLEEKVNDLTISSFHRHQVPTRFAQMVSALNARYPDTTTAKLDIATIMELLALGLAHEAAEALSDLISEGVSEQDIVVAFLVMLSDSSYGEDVSRHVKRLIRMAEKQPAHSLPAMEAIRDIIEFS